MKKLLLFVGVSALLFSCGPNRKARISGTFSGVDRDTIYLEEVTTRGRKVVDSAVTGRKGDYRFNVKLPSDLPTFYDLVCDHGTIRLLVAPGEQVKVHSIYNLTHNYTVEGSEGSQRLREFISMYDRGVKTLDSLSVLYAEIASDTEKQQEKKALLEAYTKEYYRIKREHIAFIVSNAGSMAALYALYQRLPNDASLSTPADDHIYYRLVADSLSARYPESAHVTALRQEVEQREQTLELLQRMSRGIDSPINYPEIELADMYGKKHKLSDLNGRVILVDFWSPADTRSSVLNAELRELYDEFSSKGFEVYQVALGGIKADWVNAVQQQKLPWINVSDPGGLESVTARTYNIGSLPANMLIDKNGNIVGRNYYGTALRTKITELTR